VRCDSSLNNAVERFDSLLHDAAEKFDSPLHHATERFDSTLHDKIAFEIGVSPGIEPGYIVFPSHKNNV
jgi:hypothetical protein